MWQDLTLSDKARMIDLAVKSGITDLATIHQVYNTFAEGGNLEESEPPAERRKYEDMAVTLEAYKELKRQAVRDAAVKNALRRTRGVAPVINGNDAASCLYTATDNFGPKYRVASNQLFAADPEKYGWEISGPLNDNMEGNIYMMLDEDGRAYHANLITAYDDNNNPLITYSAGHANGRTFRPMSYEEWKVNQNIAARVNQLANASSDKTGYDAYEEYLESLKRLGSPEADYKKNKKIYSTPGYETYRFIGTPEDNERWEEEFNVLDRYPTAIQIAPALNNQVSIFANGGNIHIKKENRGKFTALKKRTGHSASWFKAHGTPAQKKMATFALNARKWKHGDGGYLMTSL